MLTFW
jgi:hypothetical protein